MRSMFASTSPEQSRSRSKSRNRRREQTLTRSMQAAAASQAQQSPQDQDDFSTVSSRRRNTMGFMKYASEQKRSSTSMNRTREHARQIAMALSQDFSSSSASFADFGSVFGTNDDPFADLVAPKTNNAFRDDDVVSFTESTTRSNDDFFQLDPFSPQALAKQQPSSRRLMDVFSDPGAAVVTDWPVVRVSALTASPVAKKVPTMATMQSSNFANFSGGRMRPKAATVQDAPITPERNHHRHQSSNQSLSPAPLSTGAAARRRIRTQMRKKDESVGSPAQTRTDSVSSNIGKVTDHVANYSSKQQQHRSALLPVQKATPNQQGPSASAASSSGSEEPNLFDSNSKTGFSFDVFGLDGAEMHREVAEAMNELAGSHPGISAFLQDPTDDFATGRWDNSTTNSPNYSGAISRTSSAYEEHGFVDGFRVTKTVGLPVQHVRESPTRSERSSLTSESLDHNNNNNASVNMFKQQAGFHTSKQRKVVRPSQEKQQDLLPRAKQQQVQAKIMGMNGFKTQNLKEDPPPQRLANMPNFDENLAKVSPRRRQQEAAVEFFGEDSSTDEEAFNKAHSSLGGALVDPYHQLHRGRPASEVGTDVEPASDAGVASDMDVPSNVGASDIAPALSDVGLLPFIEVKDKKFNTRNSASVRTESTAATTAVDEKKGDESPVKSVGSLRSKWESREIALSAEAAQKRLERQHVPSSLSKEHIIRLQDQLGSDLLSPEKLMSPESMKRFDTSDEHQISRPEDTIQNRRVVECLDQRTSFASVKERLRTPLTRPEAQARETPSKSEGGAAVRHSSVNSILTSLEKKATPGGSRSDAGGSPAAVFAVQLRKTKFSPEDAPPNAYSSSAAVNQFKAANHSRSLERAGTARGKGSHNQEAPKIPFESQAMRIVRQQNDRSSGVRAIESPSKKNHPSKERMRENLSSDSREQRSQQGTAMQTGSPRSKAKNSALRGDSETEDEQYAGYGDKACQNDSYDLAAERSPKQLTYRERRELELKRREEEKHRLTHEMSNEPAQLDVASLVKQRIAANKKSLSAISSSSCDSWEQHEDISTLRNRLRPTPCQNFTDEGQNEERSESPLRCETKPNAPARHGQLDSGHCDISEVHGSARFNRSFRSEEKYLPSEVADEDEPGTQCLQSPARSSHSAQESQPDLVIGTDAPELNPAPRKAVASAAVSHMLMLQQLQQRQPPMPCIGSPKKEKEALPAKLLSAKPLVVTTHNAGSDIGADGQTVKTPKATMMMLNAFLAGRESISSTDVPGAPQVAKAHSEDNSPDNADAGTLSPLPNSLLPLKDDPKYARYFKMLSIGLPMDVVKHAMTRDGFDAALMDCDHNKPVGIPLKDDPDYVKYFKMLNIGLPMEAVKHAMERDGLDSAVMDQDHDLPAMTGKQSGKDEPKEKDSHRRARLHWKTLRKVTSNSLWAKIDQDSDLNIEIDEEEFQELFQAERTEAPASGAATTVTQKRSSTVCVIDSKRANNGGIILARLKMSHDNMADAVDRIDEQGLTAEQIENVIEYLPSKEERKALEAYMLEGGQDAAEKFEGLCECEKFMVSMMTVKHAKRKVSALLFKLQFESCIRDIQKEACAIEKACEELSSSVRLRQLLGIVLTFGNRLNTAGNGKRKAGAFTLDSLLKLNQAKAFDKKTTFLHYIILIVQRNNELLLNFKDDLPTVFASDKIFWDQCVTDLEEVENQLENVRKIALYQAHQAQSYRRRRKSKREDPDESLSDADDSLTLEEEVEALRSTPIGLFTLSAIKYVSALRDKVESTKVMFAHVLEYFGEEEKQLQPHELFSIIVSFSRDFDKAKEQVLAKEKLKQREERKRQLSSNAVRTPNSGRPPPYSPAPPENKSVNTLKASNLQPSMSNVLQQLKSSRLPLITADSDHEVPRQRSLVDSAEMPYERTAQEHSYSPEPKPISKQRTEEEPGQRSVPEPSYSPAPQRTSQHTSPRVSTPPSRPRTTMAASRAPPILQDSGEMSHVVQREESQQVRSSPSSGASTTTIAMRAKARMRRQRVERSPSSPAELSLPPSEAPTGRYPSPARSDSIGLYVQAQRQQQIPKSPARSDSIGMTMARNVRRTASDDSGAQPLSPRSNIRLKRRVEHRNRIRRSVDTGRLS